MKRFRTIGMMLWTACLLQVAHSAFADNIGTIWTSGSAKGCSGLSNGLVAMYFNAHGRAYSYSLNGTRLVTGFSNSNHSSNNPYYFSVTESNVVSGNGYDENLMGSPRLVQNSDSIAEIRYTMNSTHGVKWSIGYILRAGERMIYTYVIAEGTDSVSSVGEMRFVLRPPYQTFTHGYVSPTQQGALPTHTQMTVGRTDVQDATFRFSDGTIYTKYNWANYIDEDPFHGVYSSTTNTRGNYTGIWVIPCSTEYINGGPMRQELTVHAADDAQILLMMMQGGHFGAGASEYTKGEKKVYGPFALYFNELPVQADLITDAAHIADSLQAAWPFGFTGLGEELYPASRSTVTGTIAVDGYTSDSLRVVLAQPGSNVYDQGKDYIYWTTTDENGHFSIPNVREGNYALYAWAQKGLNTEEYKGEGVTISGANVDLGTIEWVPNKMQEVVWSIGENDRRSSEFRLSNAPRAYELYQSSRADITYTIGTSTESTDWDYAQVGNNGTWEVVFRKTKTYTGSMLLTTSIAGAANKPKLSVQVNGRTAQGWSFGHDGSITRSATQSGAHQVQSYCFPAEWLHALGENNTIRFTLSGLGTAIGGVMWDCIKLENGYSTLDLLNPRQLAQATQGGVGNPFIVEDSTLYIHAYGMTSGWDYNRVSPVQSWYGYHFRGRTANINAIDSANSVKYTYNPSAFPTMRDMSAWSGTYALAGTQMYETDNPYTAPYVEMQVTHCKEAAALFYNHRAQLRIAAYEVASDGSVTTTASATATAPSIKKAADRGIERIAVTGLDPDKTYLIRIDETGTNTGDYLYQIALYGAQEEKTATEITNYGLQITNVEKVLRDGQMFIIHGDNMYDLLGRKVDINY